MECILTSEKTDSGLDTAAFRAAYLSSTGSFNQNAASAQVTRTVMCCVIPTRRLHQCTAHSAPVAHGLLLADSLPPVGGYNVMAAVIITSH